MFGAHASSPAGTHGSSWHGCHLVEEFLHVLSKVVGAAERKQRTIIAVVKANSINKVASCQKFVAAK